MGAECKKEKEEIQERRDGREADGQDADRMGKADRRLASRRQGGSGARPIQQGLGTGLREATGAGQVASNCVPAGEARVAHRGRANWATGNRANPAATNSGHFDKSQMLKHKHVAMMDSE